MNVASLLAAIAFALTPAIGVAGDAESLDPEAAFDELSASKGVVLVDLYADW